MKKSNSYSKYNNSNSLFNNDYENINNNLNILQLQNELKKIHDDFSLEKSYYSNVDNNNNNLNQIIKIKNLENEIKNKNKIIESLTQFDENNNNNLNSKISNTIQNDFDTIEIKFKSKIEELENLKKNQKISKIKEIYLENKILYLKLNNLQNLYQKIFNQLNLYENSNNNLNNLKNKISKQDFIIINLKEKFNLLNKENFELKNENKKLLIQNNNIKNSFNDLKTKFNNQKNFNEKLLFENENIKNNKKFIEMKNNLLNKINLLKKDNNNYKESVDKKNLILKDYKEKLNFKLNNNDYYGLKMMLFNEKEKNKNLNFQLKKFEYKFTKNNYLNDEYLTKKEINNILNNNNNNNKNEENNNENNKNYNDLLNEENSDFFSNNNLNEFLYILIKNFESKKIDLIYIESEILKNSIFEQLNNENNNENNEDNFSSNYLNFILQISSNFCESLNISNCFEQNNIITFVKTIFFNFYFEQNISVSKFKYKFLNLFSEIEIYTNDKIDKLKKRLYKSLIYNKNNLLYYFKLYDFNKNGTINFLMLKKILEKLKIELKNDLLEFMIFYMKINNNKKLLLKMLNYENIIEILVTNYSIEDFNEIDDEIIEISEKDFENKIKEIIKKINKNLNLTSKNFDYFFKNLQYENEKIDLNKFVDALNNFLNINLEQIEIFCIFSKYKFNNNNNNNDEILNYNKIKFDIENLNNEIKKFENLQFFSDSFEIKNNLNDNNNNNNFINEFKKFVNDNNLNYEKIIFPFHSKMKLIKINENNDENNNNNKYERYIEFNLFKKILNSIKFSETNNNLIKFLIENSDKIFNNGLINLDYIKNQIENKINKIESNNQSIEEYEKELM